MWCFGWPKWLVGSLVGVLIQRRRCPLTCPHVLGILLMPPSSHVHRPPHFTSQGLPRYGFLAKLSGGSGEYNISRCLHSDVELNSKNRDHTVSAFTARHLALFIPPSVRPGQAGLADAAACRYFQPPAWSGCSKGS